MGEWLQGYYVGCVMCVVAWLLAYGIPNMLWPRNRKSL